ncbi:APG12-domain-containing protein [Microstroma glucosiphilum]|uniref:Ubiquitin-like protein ATG12 n=1 Tax=Pseudomicrostroma glucosiphilum TaxID=1684307 RepID=A0A316U2M1_9BASI|nr:APG12-domain-containing protein [Pseudomicrostroma glucosiphilum]PWN19566.1 APG12-domain-containing protein [Pseudomicrostroma glucosiphilum]
MADAAAPSAGGKGTPSLLTPSTPSLPITTTPSPSSHDHSSSSPSNQQQQQQQQQQQLIPPTSLPALSLYTQRDTSKVLVKFKAIGAAPIMKNNSFRITAFNKFHAVVVFLRNQLGEKTGGGGTLFLYINNSFAPSLDDTVGNLFRCFGTDGHLIVNYSTTPAFG